MKVIFIAPCANIRRNSFYRFGGNVYGHKNNITGPLILGHILKNNGHTVECYEELFKDNDYSNMSYADAICIYTMTSNAPRAYKIADFFRKKMKKKVIIGGIHASAMPNEALKYADQVIVGEGESVITDVINGTIKDKIVYAKPIKDLDTIPFPDYTLLKTPTAAANVMTSRGCPFCCNFCTTSRMFHPYRKRTPDNVIEELKIYKKMGFKYVNFEDDNFTADKERAKQILRKMIKNNLVFKETFFFGRTDMANDDELLELLSKAHLRRTLIGIESLNQESLDYINKKQKIDDIKRCGKKLAKYKIKLIASLVLGLDYDSIKNINRSVQFCKDINAYQLQPAILTPYPNTEVFKQFEEEGRLITKEWQYYDMTNVVFTPKKMSPSDLQKEFFIAAKKFYSFKGALKIFRTFGFDAGMRRLGFWFFTRFGLLYFNTLSKRNDGNLFNKLYNISNPNNQININIST